MCRIHNPKADMLSEFGTLMFLAASPLEAYRNKFDLRLPESELSVARMDLIINWILHQIVMVYYKLNSVAG